MSHVQRLREDQEMKADDTGLSRTQISDIIDEWIFSERDRQILKRRLLDGVCFEPLADEFGLSVRQVKKIVYKCTDKILKHI